MYVMQPNLWGCAPNAIIFSPNKEWHNFFIQGMRPELIRITDLVAVWNPITSLLHKTMQKTCKIWQSRGTASVLAIQQKIILSFTSVSKTNLADLNSLQLLQIASVNRNQMYLSFRTNVGVTSLEWSRVDCSFCIHYNVHVCIIQHCFSYMPTA